MTETIPTLRPDAESDDSLLQGPDARNAITGRFEISGDPNDLQDAAEAMASRQDVMLGDVDSLIETLSHVDVPPSYPGHESARYYFEKADGRINLVGKVKHPNIADDGRVALEDLEPIPGDDRDELVAVVEEMVELEVGSNESLDVGNLNIETAVLSEDDIEALIADTPELRPLIDLGQNATIYRREIDSLISIVHNEAIDPDGQQYQETIAYRIPLGQSNRVLPVSVNELIDQIAGPQEGGEETDHIDDVLTDISRTFDEELERARAGAIKAREISDDASVAEVEAALAEFERDLPEMSLDPDEVVDGGDVASAKARREAETYARAAEEIQARVEDEFGSANKRDFTEAA